MTEPPRPPGEGSYGTPPEPTPPSSSGSYQQPYPPQGGGYPPPGGGYGAPGAGMPPPGYASNDDKTWVLIAHFGGALGMFLGGGVLGFVAPLVAYLAKGQQSPAVRAHAVESLNFQMLWSIVGVIGWATACILIGFIGVFAAYAMGIIFGIIAGIKANEGQFYKYPANISIIK